MKLEDERDFATYVVGCSCAKSNQSGFHPSLIKNAVQSMEKDPRETWTIQRLEQIVNEHAQHVKREIDKGDARLGNAPNSIVWSVKRGACIHGYVSLQLLSQDEVPIEDKQFLRNISDMWLRKKAVERLVDWIQAQSTTVEEIISPTISPELAQNLQLAAMLICRNHNPEVLASEVKTLIAMIKDELKLHDTVMQLGCFTPLELTATQGKHIQPGRLIPDVCVTRAFCVRVPGNSDPASVIQYSNRQGDSMIRCADCECSRKPRSCGRIIFKDGHLIDNKPACDHLRRLLLNWDFILRIPRE